MVLVHVLPKRQPRHHVKQSLVRLNPYAERRLCLGAFLVPQQRDRAGPLHIEHVELGALTHGDARLDNALDQDIDVRLIESVVAKVLVPMFLNFRVSLRPQVLNEVVVDLLHTPHPFLTRLADRLATLRDRTKRQVTNGTNNRYFHRTLAPAKLQVAKHGVKDPPPTAALIGESQCSR